LRWENSSVRAELEWIRKEYEQLHSQNASLKVGDTVLAIKLLRYCAS
jgi:hypothetical protein